MRAAPALAAAAILLAALVPSSAGRPSELGIDERASCPFPDARLVAAHAETRVGVDNATALAAMALAAATGETLSLRDLTQTRSVSVVTCAVRLRVPGVFDASVTLSVVTTCEHEVRLPADLGMSAVALARSGIPIHVHDVLSERDSCVVTLERAQGYDNLGLWPSR